MCVQRTRRCCGFGLGPGARVPRVVVFGVVRRAYGRVTLCIDNQGSAFGLRSRPAPWSSSRLGGWPAGRLAVAVDLRTEAVAALSATPQAVHGERAPCKPVAAGGVQERAAARGRVGRVDAASATDEHAAAAAVSAHWCKALQLG